MKIEAILSFETLPQQWIETEVNNNDIDSIMSSDQALFEYLVDSSLTEEEFNKLRKISCCVYCEGENYTPPAWYMECNGKLWIENGKLY